MRQDLVYFIDSTGKVHGGFDAKSLGIVDIKPSLADRIFHRLMKIYGSDW